MTAERDPLEQLLDLAVYAPVGLALSARERLPGLAERGRREIEARVPAARFVGQMVIDHGSREVKKRVDQLPGRVMEVLSGLGLLSGCAPSDDPETPGPDDRDPASSPAPVVPLNTDVEPVVPPVVEPASAAPVQPIGEAPVDTETATLPIPGYDTLSASQVVQRLPGLSAAELDAISAYEAARRGRKIVLMKAAQLRAAS